MIISKEVRISVNNLIALLVLLIPTVGHAQIIFSETFDEPAGSTTGAANGVNWTATCPTCLAGDYHEVQNGTLETGDSNGPAEWITNGINISACSHVIVTFDVSESGTMEACGTGCVSADWVAFEYSVDGGPWTSPANAYACGGGCAPPSGMAILDDDITSTNYSTGCIAVNGNSLQLRITTQCWAGSEVWNVDNVVVNCEDVDPGTNAAVDACTINGNINLLGELGGTPNATGTWTGPSALINGSQGTFDPNTNLAGIYTYTDGVLCPESADVTVTISNPVAGTNGNVQLCSNDPATNLITLLGGTPDAGGFWTGPSALTGGDQGTFTPGTNAAGTYTYTVGPPGCQATADVVVTVVPCSNCSMTDLTINVTNCYVNGGFLEYDIAGVLTFTNPPTTGQLVITDCYGATQTFNPPFVSPFNFTQTNMPQTGAQCDFTAVFTDDPTCTIVGPHQAPPPITGFSSNCVIGAGIVTGDITFDDTYGSGFLVVSIDDGTNVLDTMITLPTTSPQNWSVSGLNPAANPYTISYYFSDYPGCSQTTTINCGCQADAGTYNVSMTGNGNTNFILCDGDQVDITTNNDFIDPDNNGPLGGFPYDPGIAWLIYNCPPTPGVDPNNDPCFQGIFNAPNGSGNMSDINDLGIINNFPAGTFNNNEVFYVPITMYNFPNLLYNTNCWNVGTPISVTYLTPITSAIVEDCPNGSVTVTLNGGHPEIFGTNFTASNLLPATASFANTTAAHGGTITITGLQDGDMYSFDVVDQNGCPIQVTGGPFVGPPDATIAPAGPFCPTDPALNLTAATPGGTWSGTGITNTTNGTFDPATAGTGVHSINYTVGGACPGNGQTDIIVTNQQDATITPVPDPCETDAPFILNVVDPGGTFTATCGACVDATTGTFNPQIAGVGLHTITYTIAGTCGDVQTLDINVMQSFDAALGAMPDMCIGNANTFVNVLGDAGGTFSGVGIIDPTTGEFDPIVAGAGTHVITYSFPGPCGNSETTTITVNDPLSVTAFIDMDICEGQNANLSAVANGGDGNYTYTWTDDQGNPAGVGQFITVTPAVTTTYTVTVTDGCGSNAATDQVTVTVNPLPTIDFVVDNATGCAPLTVTFTDNSVPAGTTCLWDFGDTFFSTDCGTTTHTYTDPGCYDVSLTITTAAGCSNSMTQTSMVCVTPNALAAFDVDPGQVDVNAPIFNFTNNSSNATTYSWTFGDGENSMDTDPSHTYPAIPGMYEVCLTAMNDEGCNDIVCDSVQILDVFSVYVPNAFTPNGDGFNDEFLPVVNGIVSDSYELYIFDRWGHIIFESNSQNIGWNGNDPSGVLAKSDVYVWKLILKSSVDDEHYEKVGHVTLLK